MNNTFYNWNLTIMAAAKDEDAVKLFVGQLPRTMNEVEMKVYFEEFGPAWEVSILKDKATGVSKGIVLQQMLTTRVRFFDLCDQKIRAVVHCQLPRKEMLSGGLLACTTRINNFADVAQYASQSGRQ